MGVFIKIGLRSRATAPGPICSASGSLIRALHRVCRKHRARESLHYVSGLPVPSLKRVRPLRSPFTMVRTRKLLPAKAGKRLRSLDLEMKWGSLLKSGSGVAPPHPARPAALPGPSFGLGTASAAAESLHDGTDPEARTCPKQRIDCGAWTWK